MIKELKEKFKNKNPEEIVHQWKVNEGTWKLHEHSDYFNAGFYVYMYFEDWIQLQLLKKDRSRKTKTDRRWKILLLLLISAIYIGIDGKLNCLIRDSQHKSRGRFNRKTLAKKQDTENNKRKKTNGSNKRKKTIETNEKEECFDDWLNVAMESGKKIVVVRMSYYSDKKRHHSYSIYEYEYIKLSETFRRIKLNLIPGNNPMRIANAYNLRDPEFSIAGFIFQN